ncbi:phosphatase PAP2 family protein [Actinomadura sp. DC4]|uniref:phosphatase PAP2 family protein n=1 Tax=Actinomadura sp. DC4 TaxID=3055069 RepID=UPI0025B030D7|nr:phosphatase PAP2 family protein [Actinomadura sp. DC4]MDN3355972.1 phosphatase PAP2 family protein [Actinomadura sp. DC4]
MDKGSLARWTRRHPDGSLGLRLFLACLAVFLVAVPFTGLAALVDTRWGPLRRLDLSSTKHANSWVLHHHALVSPLRATSYIFHAWVFRLIVTGLAVWLFHQGARRLAAWAMTTLVAAGFLDVLLKVVIDRPRPTLPSAIAHAPGGSFPSGHALTAVVGTTTIVLILLPVLHGRWRVVAWAAAILISVASGACRVLLGVHFVSDVLAGWILGAAIVVGTSAAFETWRRDEGREPVHPIQEGTEPEAAEEIAGHGDHSHAT